MQLTKILCLDIDGTVRRSKSGKTFIEGPDDIEIIPGMKERIWKYKNEGWAVIGISNQAGVAHGFRTFDQVLDEMVRTMKLTSNEDDEDPFTTIHLCPMDEKGSVPPYNARSLCRKPGTGLLAQAEYNLSTKKMIADWDNSLFVGDRPEDQECAKRAGIPFMWAHDFVLQPIT